MAVLGWVLLLPGHTTVSRFLNAHRAGVQGLFAQVLRLCHEAGMVRLKAISIDGTKIAANVQGPYRIVCGEYPM